MLNLANESNENCPPDLHYRGYYYDTETGFYYLQSRYYDPATHRFINADNYASTGQGLLGYNMFAYCRNNPVNRKDASGTADVCVEDFNQDNNTFNDLGNPTGSGSGNGGAYNTSSYTTSSSASSGYTSNGYYSSSVSYTLTTNSSSASVSLIKSSRLSFKSKSVLNEHYKNHNHEFGNAFRTPEEYVDTANYVIQNGEYIPNQNAYVKFYGMNGRANFAFVGVSYDHSYITTFHLKYAGQVQF